MQKKRLKPYDIKSKEDLPKLPILTKKLFKENFPHKLTAQNLPKRIMRLDSSSGSTGNPIQLQITQSAYSFNKACNLRGWYWMGYNLGIS